MPVPIPLLPAGAKPRGDDFNKLRAQLESQRITGAAGVMAGAFSGGSTLAALGLPPVVRRTPPRTFLVTGSGPDVLVAAGAINNVVYAGGTLTTPTDGDKVYIDATIDSAGTVTALTVSKASSVPSNTTTHVYTLLATVAVASSIATPTPVAWNYSQMQMCGGQALWGGFGA